jgi:CubicO group peptidase (beta-lactamase class C family)
MAEQLSADGLASFAAVAARHVGDADVPGLVALVARGAAVHVEAQGSLSIGGSKVRRDSLFRIASMTKPVTGAATLALVGEGLLGLDEPVDTLLPELSNRRVLRRMDGPLDDTVPAVRPVTVRDLLTFTFGFGLVFEMFTPGEPWPVVTATEELHLGTLGLPDPGEPPDPETWIAGLGSLPLMAQPGDRWMYNTGASVLGVLLARAADMPFAEVLRTRIFEPLAMADTSFWTSDTGRLATGYRTSAEGLQVAEPPSGGWSKPPAFCDGASGLVSTVDDMLSFSRMLLSGGLSVLSKQAVGEMTRDQLTFEQRKGGKGFLLGRSWGFCQSIVTEGPRKGAFGWNGGFGTSWLADPLRDLSVIVLTQRMFESPEPPKVHAELQDAAYAAIS